MRRIRRAVSVFIMLVLGLPGLASGAELKVGDKAPSFTLFDQNRQPVTLNDFLGKKNVVLAFYVLAFTGG